jgi:hypothetical protein
MRLVDSSAERGARLSQIMPPRIVARRRTKKLISPMENREKNSLQTFFMVSK